MEIKDKQTAFNVILEVRFLLAELTQYDIKQQRIEEALKALHEVWEFIDANC